MLFGKMSHNEVHARFRLWRNYRSFFKLHARHFQEKIVATKHKRHEATLKDVFSRCSIEPVFLKIDIEGSEYQIIEDILLFAHRIVALVIEFHDTENRDRFCRAVKRLQSRFEIVHLHGNNCAPRATDGLPQVIELTLISHNSHQIGVKRAMLPIENLDSPNHEGWPDYLLQFDV